MGTFLVLVGLIIFCWGLGGLVKSLIKKRKKKKNVIVLITAFALMIFGSLISPTSHYSDSSRETTHSKKKITAKNDSSKAKDEQKKKAREKERKAKEEKQKQEKERKEKEEKQKQEKERQAREREQKIAEATSALVQAEATPTRDNYNTALSAIQSIPDGDQELSNRLINVETTIKANEAAEAKRQAEQQAAAQAQRQAEQQAAAQAQQQAEQQNNSYSFSGQWAVAANGMVFARSDSGKYYSRVTSPNNYQYMTQVDADNAGYIRAPRGNQYARP